MPALKAIQALARLIPNLKAKIPACITTTKQRPARSIVVEVSMKNFDDYDYSQLKLSKMVVIAKPCHGLMHFKLGNESKSYKK